MLADTGALCDFHFFYVAVSAPQESFNFNLKYLSEKRQKYSSLIGEKGYPLPPPPLKSKETEQPGIEVGFSTCKGRGTCLTGITSLTHTQSCCPKKKRKSRIDCSVSQCRQSKKEARESKRGANGHCDQARVHVAMYIWRGSSIGCRCSLPEPPPRLALSNPL